MGNAAIIIKQSDSNMIPGSREDLVLGSSITLSNQDNSGIVSWLWQIVDKPTGSNVSLSTSTSSTSTFIPDIEGTYLVKLTLNSGVFVDQVGAAIKTTHLHYRIPAASEQGEFNPTRGWADAVCEVFTVLDDGYGNLFSSIGAAGTVTKINSGIGLTGGPITSTGTLNLAASGVAPNSYTTTNITVDAYGRVTSASNGSGVATSLNASGAQGTLLVQSTIAGDANSNLFLRYTPTEIGASQWGEAFYNTPNTGSIFNNQVHSEGWNIGPTGSPLVGGVAQLGWSYESFYQPVSTSFSEAHLFTTTDTGTTFRPISLQHNRTDGTNNLALSPNNLLLQNPGQGTTWWTYNLNDGGECFINTNQRPFLLTLNNVPFFSQRNANNTAYIDVIGLNNLNKIEVGYGGISTIFDGDIEVSTNAHIDGYLSLSSIAEPPLPPNGKLILYSFDVNGIDQLQLHGSDGLDVVMGQDSIATIHNSSGSVMTYGQAVYIINSSVPSTITIPNVGLAQAGSLNSMPAYGLVLDSTIGIDGYGRVMRTGILDNLNTSALGSAGAVLYLSATTPGAYTHIDPGWNNFSQHIGIVLNASLTGSIAVDCTADFNGNEQGTISNNWGIGDTTIGNKTISFQSGTNRMALVSNPTTARTIAIPDASGTFTTLENAQTFTAKQTFSNHIAVDGYTINLSGGMAIGGTLGYNGTNIIPSTGVMVEGSQAAFFGNTPISQPTTAGNTTINNAGSGATIKADTTSDGGLGGTAYTMSDLVRHLKQLGLIAS